MRPKAYRLTLISTICLTLVACLNTPANAAQKLLRINFNGPITETPADDMGFAALFGGMESRSLHQWLELLDNAAHSNDISGVVMIVEQPQMSFAQLQELTRALRDVRDGGKPVYCYLDYAGNLGYALAAAADHITVAENSILDIAGLRAELMYFKGMLDKIGVQPQMLHCGDYKSAHEPFSRTGPSEAAAENINWLLTGLYDAWIDLIAQGRGLTSGEVKIAVDNAPLIVNDAKEQKLVDAVGSYTSFKNMLHNKFGHDLEVVRQLGAADELGMDFDVDPNNPFAMLNKIGQIFGKLSEEASKPDKKQIAILYIEGSIVVGKNETSPFGSSGVAGSTTIRAAFEEARKDDNIEAVVVRVNSPGGSALASDIMWKAATRCAEQKPVIVSMGGVAGSGGYYVAIPGKIIFAEEATITGSIGVVGGKFVWKNLLNDKLGITTAEFTRGANADLMSMNHPWTADEKQWMQNFMNEIYDQFKNRVHHSRGERLKGNLDDMAGGRVYTGKQALERGLVDRLGGLGDALDYAAKDANLTDYDVVILPKQPDFAEVLKQLLGEPTDDDWKITLNPRTRINDPIIQLALPLLQQLAPQQAQRVMQALTDVAILNREHVGCMMPFQFNLR